MQYVIAVFRSRNETLYLANMFKTRGVIVGVINTPKEAGQACGISVRFDEKFLPMARQFLTSKPFRSFYGFFRVKTLDFNHRIVERISWFDMYFYCSLQ